ncbi:hypothetical protein ACFVXC_10870 [Streptomyces sp. NPDC058257]|uniref:hypothetical protein n=1 Tax=Streptomyces sp. NPDC058257 TaxID=3346409 RepID=UPI0036E70A8A
MDEGEWELSTRTRSYVCRDGSWREERREDWRSPSPSDWPSQGPGKIPNPHGLAAAVTPS